MSDYSCIPRWRKLLHIGQAHLAPGMSSQKLRDIFRQYQIDDTWEEIPDLVVDKIFGEIAVIVASPGRN